MESSSVAGLTISRLLDGQLNEAFTTDLGVLLEQSLRGQSRRGDKLIAGLLRGAGSTIAAEELSS